MSGRLFCGVPLPGARTQYGSVRCLKEDGHDGNHGFFWTEGAANRLSCDIAELQKHVATLDRQVTAILAIDSRAAAHFRRVDAARRDYEARPQPACPGIGCGRLATHDGACGPPDVACDHGDSFAKLFAYCPMCGEKLR